MKYFIFFFICFITTHTVFAQHPIQLRTIWTRPQVHVLFNGYTVSFTIHDIDKALALLDETGNHKYGRECGLDTAGDYIIELYPGLRMEYRNPLQVLIQKAVGAFLLGTGHALVQNKKHKKMMGVTKDMEPIIEGETGTVFKFYDPKTGQILFSGVMDAAMYTQDIGFD